MKQLKLQQQPNKWSCLPTAFAMVLDVPVQEIIDTVGHDGSEVPFPNITIEPYRFKSFHIQEMIDVCMLRNIAVIGIEKQPVSELKGGLYTIPVSEKRFEYYLVNYNGVLVGHGFSGQSHAVAWCGKVYDPNGTVYDLPHFNPNMFFITVRINITAGR